MGVKPETPLQASIKRLIRKRGGYCNKNHGDMTTEPGIADITAGYRGFYLAIEAKYEDNTPSVHQGIHARNVIKANCISIVAWSVDDVKIVLDIIDEVPLDHTIYLRARLKQVGVDDGSKY
jgi:hypothetical protein